MIVAMVAAQLWGVVQLAVLGSLTGTIRLRTAMLAVAVGLLTCAPLAFLVQWLWIHFAAPPLGMTAYELATPAGYTVDPFIEEIVKILPLATLLGVPAIRRQWSVTDCVVIGAAIGSGFGLAEVLYLNGVADRSGARAPQSGWRVASAGAVPRLCRGKATT